MAIHITNPTELQNIDGDLANDYILDNDLDMTGVVWSPIGIASAFTGTFDGQGFTIRNLTCHDIADAFFACGLFGYCDGATIQNLNLDTVILIGNSSIGAITGDGTRSTITNCHAINVSITQDHTNGNIQNVGGLIGGTGSGFTAMTVSECHAEVVMNFSALGGSRIQRIGGLAGDIESVATITNCYATGSITNSGEDRIYPIGGLIGYFSDSTGGLTISGCYSNVEIISSGAATTVHIVGGFIGQYVNNANVFSAFECYSIGNISCSGGDAFAVGGFIGELDSGSATSPIINKCYSTGNIITSGVDCESIGGFIGYFFVSGGVVKNCYSHGNITTTFSGHNDGTGGFIGEITQSSSTTIIKNCYSSGNVTANGQVSSDAFIGGFVGQYQTNNQVNPTYLGNCYSVGIVTITGSLDTYVGGFIGMYYDYVLSGISNCSWYTGAYSRAIGGYFFDNGSGPTWDVGITYSVNAFAIYNDSTHIAIYISLLNGNIANIPVFGGDSNWGMVGELFYTLEEMGWGTDESDNTAFYSKDYVVYKESTFPGKTIVTGTLIDTDTVLLLHFNNNLDDSSSFAKVISDTGSAGFSTDSKFGSHSISFNKGGHLVIPYDSDFSNLYDSGGVNLWTIDFWLKVDEDDTTLGIFCNKPDNPDNSILLYRFAHPFVNDLQIDGGSGNSSSNPKTVTVSDGWVHIAIEKAESGFIFLYINGIKEATAAIPTKSVDSSPNLYIGTYNPTNDTNQGLVGKIDEFRFSKIARYQGFDFNVPLKEYDSSTTLDPIVIPANTFEAWDITNK